MTIVNILSNLSRVAKIKLIVILILCLSNLLTIVGLPKEELIVFIELDLMGLFIEFAQVMIFSFLGVFLFLRLMSKKAKVSFNKYLDLFPISLIHFVAVLFATNGMLYIVIYGIKGVLSGLGFILIAFGIGTWVALKIYHNRYIIRPFF
ncbi:hypothetical protein [Reichenbachiella sp. MALMAid0571]|uniref:hypothetical protein n=1 Tax=Reichenbachiella sp. MALMAid0571 TaxID=3143939 RepID=UPI0032DF43EF